MKKIIITSFVFLLMINCVNSADVFCCKELVTYQDKCYITGDCCGGYWYNSCYDFEIDASGTSVFRVGQKTPIVLYIKNTGYYSDSYTITNPPEIESETPHLIQIDMTDATQATDVPGGQTKRVHPKITILSSNVVGYVNFIATSPNVGSKYDDLYISGSDDYLSLPEFSSISFIQLMLISWIVYYFLIRKKI